MILRGDRHNTPITRQNSASKFPTFFSRTTPSGPSGGLAGEPTRRPHYPTLWLGFRQYFPEVYQPVDHDRLCFRYCSCDCHSHFVGQYYALRLFLVWERALISHKIQPNRHRLSRVSINSPQGGIDDNVGWVMWPVIASWVSFDVVLLWPTNHLKQNSVWTQQKKK